MRRTAHITTRRAFIAGAGFGGVSLYGLWVGYGAAPSPLALLGEGHGDDHGGGHGAGQGGHHDVAPSAAHAGHGSAMPSVSVDEFRRQTGAFIARFRAADGSVHPGKATPAQAAMADDHGHGAHEDVSSSPAAASPVNVLVFASKWYFEPDHLRLDVGVPYRFRMMAGDVSHGASIQLGVAARMIRLRPGRVVEMEVRFTRPGRHLVYCTVYCGDAHDSMKARIDVA